MKKLFSTLAATLFLTATGATHAGCDFFEHINFQGEVLRLADGECAMLHPDHAQSDICTGFKAVHRPEWNDRISSVRFHHNSIAELHPHVSRADDVYAVSKTAGEFPEPRNDEASTVICRQP